VQLLPVLENLYSDLFLSFMIETPETDSESSSSQSPLHFVPVIEHFSSFIEIVSMNIIIASIKQFAVGLFALWIRRTSAPGKVIGEDLLPRLRVDKPNDLLLLDLLLLVLRQVRLEQATGLPAVDWEDGLGLSPGLLVLVLGLLSRSLREVLVTQVDLAGGTQVGQVRGRLAVGEGGAAGVLRVFVQALGVVAEGHLHGLPVTLFGRHRRGVRLVHVEVVRDLLQGRVHGLLGALGVDVFDLDEVSSC